jgi:hypothetical protein
LLHIAIGKTSRQKSIMAMIRLNQTPTAGNSFILHLAPSASYLPSPSEKPIHLSQKREGSNALSKALGTAPGREQKSVPYIQASSAQRLQPIPSPLRFARFHWQRQRNATADLLRHALLDQ